MKFPHEGRYEPAYGQIAYVHDGVAFPMSNSAALMRAIEDFECAASDVTIVGFPKSGTNWLQAMVQKLYDDDWSTLRASGGVVPHLDIGSLHGVYGFEYCETPQRPRLMKAHSHLRHMPRQLREQGIGKVLYVSRNPKDVCDSLYNQMDSLREQQGFTLDWTGWVEHFVAGRVTFGPWLDHVAQWLARGREQGVLHLRFEDMRKDPPRTLKQVIDFIGRPVAEEKIEAVIEQTEFSRMQQGEGAKLYNGPVARREGKAGGWRAHFTAAQSALFDREIVVPLEQRGIRFDYGGEERT
jgi:hypothetical protein